MNREIIDAKKFFENHGVPLCDFWLESCINWCHQEIENTSYTMEYLHGKIYEQWLLLDLRDVKVPQLPPNINNEKKIILNKSLALQMMSVIDISKPKLSQLQKIKNLNALTREFDDDNKEFTPAAKRMLQLTLTDGLQEIKAIEYKPISELNINFAPGLKIKINTPIMIRRGQIMLEEHNLQLLGGEVEEILVSCAVENVLSRHLNLPENPNPNMVDETTLADSVNETQNNSYNKNISANRVTNQNIQPILTNCSNENQNKTINNENIIDVSDEEELLMLAEAERLIQAENKVNQCSKAQTNAKKSINKHNKVGQSKIDEDIEMLLELEQDILEDTNVQQNIKENRLATLNESHINNVPTSETKPNRIPERSLNSSLEGDDDIFNSFEMEKHLTKIEEKYHLSKPKTIGDILKNIKNNKFGKYRTHAKFKSVLKKVTVTDNKWIVEICITDNLNDLGVYIHTDILSDMTRCTAEEAMNLKRDVANKNKDAMNKIMTALDRCRNELLKLDCMMEIEFSKGDMPLVITKLL